MADRTERTVAIVTGGSKGLGRALVAGLLDDGWTVVTDARHADTLATTAATLVAEHAGGDADRLVALAGDQRDAGHVDDLVTEAERLGGPHLVVLNAGDLGPSPLPHVADLAPDDLIALFDANVVGPAPARATGPAEPAPHARHRRRDHLGRGRRGVRGLGRLRRDQVRPRAPGPGAGRGGARRDRAPRRPRRPPHRHAPGRLPR